MHFFIQGLEKPNCCIVSKCGASSWILTTHYHNHHQIFIYFILLKDRQTEAKQENGEKSMRKSSIGSNRIEKRHFILTIVPTEQKEVGRY